MTPEEHETSHTDLERRLRRADPARSLAPPDPSAPTIRDLMEATMASTTTPTPTRRRTAWAAAAAAVALVLAGGVTAAVVLDGEDAPPAAAPAPLQLSLPDPAMMSSCIRYSVDILAQMPTAFAGTVRAVDGDSVDLSVDRWYRGGDADTVELVNQAGPMTSIDGVEFTPGTRYLVTASQEGAVSTCGYTAEWSPQMERDFETAFGQQSQ